MGKAESWDIASGDGGMMGSVALLRGGEKGGVGKLVRGRWEGL